MDNEGRAEYACGTLSKNWWARELEGKNRPRGLKSFVQRNDHLRLPAALGAGGEKQDHGQSEDLCWKSSSSHRAIVAALQWIDNGSVGGIMERTGLDSSGPSP
jgi:hypothetical protein